MKSLGVGLLFALWGVAALARAAVQTGGGEELYQRGLLPSGGAVHAERAGGIDLNGAEAACANCHRRSGYGTSEGQVRIPPIIGSILYQPVGRHALDTQAGPGYTPGRGAYTDATLARAIREGVAPTGRKLSYVMPRYALDEASMRALIDYLKSLSAHPPPGVTPDTLHFATIITPDADPIVSKAMLDVLQRFFEDKNAFRKGGTRMLQRTAQINFRVVRTWQLHVWRLAGPPDTWRHQLRRKLAEEPVFAVLSGLGGRNWEPVHRFCQEESLPCLFPNVDLPVIEESDFYSVYFSKGVILEAQLMAGNIAAQMQSAQISRVVQIYRTDDIGLQAATELKSALADSTVAVQSRPLRTDSAAELSSALKDLRASDRLVLWLRTRELAQLPAPPAYDAPVLISGLMGGLENALLPAQWRRVARLTYPADLPQQRAVRMHNPLAWFAIKRIPILAERVQSDTYLACGILAEALSEMLDDFYRDLLIERLETMLSTRLFTGYYPRLTLGQNQRFASKGGTIARFADAQSPQLVVDQSYTVP